VTAIREFKYPPLTITFSGEYVASPLGPPPNVRFLSPTGDSWFNLFPASDRSVGCSRPSFIQRMLYPKNIKNLSHDIIDKVIEANAFCDRLDPFWLLADNSLALAFPIMGLTTRDHHFHLF
jgi:hypothetical protein